MDMPNDYFQFKHFLIMQDKTAMKVCTEVCLFGSFIPTSNVGEEIQVLDIGTGTGLLSLMYAQKSSNAIIDAIEIDIAAANQARENFDNSSWKERLNVYKDSIQNFASSTNKKYDVIICNPPFYENDLKSENAQRNIALHSDALTLKELVSTGKLLLSDDGSFFVLLPYRRTKYFEELLVQHELCVREKVYIKQTPKHNYFRTMFWVDKNATACNQSEIIIMNDENRYSNQFIELLKDYYLHL